MELTKEEQKVYKEKLIVTFKAFDKFCKENNLTYFAMGGTMLGAIRHQDIIPWDDDIDVFMSRKDYDKFLSLKKSLEDSDYRIIDIDDENYYLTFAKFYDAHSSILEMKDVPCVFGIYIDVFVLDEVEGPYAEVVEKVVKYQKLSNDYLLSCIVRPWSRVLKTLLSGRVDKFIWYVWQKYQHTCKKQIREKMFDIRTSKGSSNEKWLVAFTAIAGERDVFKYNLFDDLEFRRFNDMEILVPTQYDAYLTQTYGDYMTPPPTEKQVTRHIHYYFNPNRLVSVSEALAATTNA